MTVDRNVLAALIEAVEAGVSTRLSIEEMGINILPKMVDGVNAGAAYHGSLNAANALHDALLPGWHWSVSQCRSGGRATVWHEPDKCRASFSADDPVPSRALAEVMRDAIAESEPEELGPGDWHLPYIPTDVASNNVDRGEFTWEEIAMISAARCARVSYCNHDGSNPDIEKDIALAKRLLESRHMSPSEHQARVSGDDGTALWGNLVGWDQFRKMIEAAA